MEQEYEINITEGEDVMIQMYEYKEKVKAEIKEIFKLIRDSHIEAEEQCSNIKQIKKNYLENWFKYVNFEMWATEDQKLYFYTSAEFELDEIIKDAINKYIAQFSDFMRSRRIQFEQQYIRKAIETGKLDQEEENLMATRLKEEEFCIYGSDLEKTVAKVKKICNQNLMLTETFIDPEEVQLDDIYKIKEFGTNLTFDNLRDKIWVTIKPIFKSRKRLFRKLKSSPADLELTLRIFLSSQTGIHKEEAKIICAALREELNQLCSKIPDFTSTIEDFESKMKTFETYPELFCEKK